VRYQGGGKRAMERPVATRRLERLIRRRPRAHMIHIGKTGGTALKDSLKPVVMSGRYEIILHGHETCLDHIPVGEKVFFVLRDPVDRYVSGFNSRLRCGRPRYFTPWTPSEQVAFEEFGSADSLGRALSSATEGERSRALRAMMSIEHVCSSYWHWFSGRYDMERRADDLLFAAWFPDLSASFPRLRELLGLEDSVTLPDDDVRAHRTPSGVDRSLSALARTNLRYWYGCDYAFIEFCAELDACASVPKEGSPGIVVGEIT
jgi:hypothetical protein